MSNEEKKDSQNTRKRVNQTDFPQISLLKALRIIQAIQDQYAGQPTAPFSVAIALSLEPSSGYWRNLAGTSLAYGLTEGGYAAKFIEITPLGKRIIAPTEEGDDKKALREAVLQPVIMRQFFERYNRAKFPDTRIATNVLVELGLPRERTESAIEILIENGKETGILLETTNGLFVTIDEAPSLKGNSATPTTATLPSIQSKVQEINNPNPIRNSGLSFGNGLYVNFEIHIAADTPISTVEAIFKNMRKYLMENDR